MNKLLSFTLGIAVGVGSTGLQAGNTMERALAYTKIALGGVSLAAGGYMPWQANSILQNMDEPLGSGEADAKKVVSTGRNKVLVQVGFLSPVALLPLGILLIKDGRRDLRRIGKRAAQEANKTATDNKEVPLELSE